MIDIQGFNELVRSRRSVFPDQLAADKKVDDEIVKDILTNATWAPNHGKEEPWQFTVFSGDGLKKLADMHSAAYKELSGDKFKEATFFKFQHNPLKASHVIALGMKRSTNKNIPEFEDIAALAASVQNIYLSVTAYGLGGYWTTSGLSYLEPQKEFFGLGNEDRLLGFFYLGHVAIPSTGAKRKPVEEKVNWING
jgi:nitroreductase